MTDSEVAARLDELDRLLNDPTRRMEPDRVWSLAAEIALQQQAMDSRAQA